MGASESRRNRWLFLSVPIVLAILVGVGVAIRTFIRPSDTVRGDTTRDEDPEKGMERAERLREFREAHQDEINVRTDASLRSDPTYAESLMNVDRESINKLNGFTPEEKEELWRTMQEAQKRAAQHQELEAAKRRAKER